MSIRIDCVCIFSAECRPFFLKFGMEGGTFLAKQAGISLIRSEADGLSWLLFAEVCDNGGLLGTWIVRRFGVMVKPPFYLLCVSC